MSHSLKYLLALALVAGVAAAPISSWAESGSKSKSVEGTKKSDAGGVDEFEENRKAHMQKSKENNEKKGAN